MSSSIKTVARKGGIVAGCAVLAAFAVQPVTHAHEEPDRRAKAIAAGWLNGRLDDGLLHASYADFQTGDPVAYVDYGGTVEGGYALDAVNRGRLLPRMTDALEGSVDSYITGADFGSPDDVYAGPTGKLLAFVTDLGGDADPSSFGGRDLVSLMEDMTIDVGSEDAGRISDLAATDYANVFGQIWATRGLLAVDSAEAPAAVDYLLSTQCSDGRFTTYFTDSCAAAAAGPDATALAVIMLSKYAAGDTELSAALDDAVGWLLAHQSASGAFTDDAGVANANSTGLGGWAVGLHERDRAARKAAIWLRARQVPGRACDGKLARQRGAIAYSTTAYKQGRRKGIVPLTAGEWQTVAVQAIPALAHAPASHVKLGVRVKRTVKAGGTARVKVVGLAPGERACVGIGRRLKSVVGPRGDQALVVRVAVPGRGKKVVRVLTANAVARARTTAR